MNKAIVIFVIGAALAGLIIWGKSGSEEKASRDNVRIENGVQIVEILAKGGYRPRLTEAQAGIPTVVRVKTSSTFDCSRALRVPSQNINTILPQSGMYDIDLGSPEVGTFDALCSMGMYRFAVEFK